MVQCTMCKHWYHCSCAGLPEVVAKRVAFSCCKEPATVDTYAACMNAEYI